MVLSRLQPADKELALLLIDTGFRLDDIMHVRLWQLCKPTLTLLERKTGKLRSVSLSHIHIKHWTESSSEKNPLSFAFPRLARRGKRKNMHRTTFWRHFAEAVKACGFAGCGYSPHSLRKVYAVNLLRRTRSLEKVQKDLGHSHIGTTALYAFSDAMGGSET